MKKRNRKRQESSLLTPHSSFLTPVLFILSMLGLHSCADTVSVKPPAAAAQEKHLTTSDTLTFTLGIRNILHDTKGNYWIGSNAEGVSKFDGSKFTYFNTENGLCGNQIISLQEDQLGQIWFGTSSGLCYYDGKNVRRAERFIPSAWMVTRNDIWFPGSSPSEIIRVDQGVAYAIKNPIVIPENVNPMNYDITSFAHGNNNDLWIGYYNGVAHVNETNTTFINNESMGYDGKSMYMHVRSLFFDSKGRLWIGNNGIGVMLQENEKITHFTKDQNLFHGEVMTTQSPEGTLMHVFAIAEDAQGNIWFGDRDTGVWRYDGKEMKHFVMDSALYSNQIWAIYKDRLGNLLFASADRHVYKFNGTNFTRFF